MPLTRSSKKGRTTRPSEVTTTRTPSKSPSRVSRKSSAASGSSGRKAPSKSPARKSATPAKRSASRSTPKKPEPEPDPEVSEHEEEEEDPVPTTPRQAYGETSRPGTPFDNPFPVYSPAPASPVSMADDEDDAHENGTDEQSPPRSRMEALHLTNYPADQDSTDLYWMLLLCSTLVFLHCLTYRDWYVTWGADWVSAARSFQRPEMDIVMKAFAKTVADGLVPIIAFGLLGRGDVSYVSLVEMLCFGTLMMSVVKVVTVADRPVNSRVDGCAGQEGLGDYSFPSGHSMAAILLWLFMTSRGRFSLLRVPGVLFVLIASGSRLYTCAHFPHDVLAGWSLGIAAYSAHGLTIRSLQQPMGSESLHWRAWMAMVLLVSALPAVLLLDPDVIAKQGNLGASFGLAVGATLAPIWIDWNGFKPDGHSGFALARFVMAVIVLVGVSSATQTFSVLSSTLPDGSPAAPALLTMQPVKVMLGVVLAVVTLLAPPALERMGLVELDRGDKTKED